MSKARKSFNKFKKRLFLAILILVPLVLVGIYINRGLVLNKKATISIPSTSFIPISISAPSQVKTNSPSWNKYQGFGFTFEYPDGWKVEEINSWSNHEYEIYDPTSGYEVDYKGVATSHFNSRTWAIMVISEKERRNYLENDKLLSPAEYAKFYCETVKSTGTLMASPSPQNGKDAFQAKCFTVADEYLIYNDNFFATVLLRAYGGKEADDETTSRFLSSIKISQ